MKIRALLSLFLVTAVFLSACGNSKGESSKEETKDALDIYTTVYPLQYFTEAIGRGVRECRDGLSSRNG
ncbi:hypothetical protein RCO48_18695 [Peribacillus frigoritolerans]|nr:hypothetical protein [Peribacillus frigoritolerans]